MTELEQILKHLKTLQGRGWNIRLDGFRILFGNFEFLATLDPNYFLEQDEWCIRGFIEREIEARGLWALFKRTLDNAVPQLESLPPQQIRRPILLEVLQAAVEVTG